MRPSTNCYSFIQREEGEVLHPYRDQRGKPTIGIGCTMYEDGTPVKMSDPAITHERALRLLRLRECLYVKGSTYSKYV
jgi:GH24 family phage-related lysozyme (muramidase)